MSKKRIFNFLFGFVILIFLVNIASIKTAKAAVCFKPCDDISGANAIFELIGPIGCTFRISSIEKTKLYGMGTLCTGPIEINHVLGMPGCPECEGLSYCYSRVYSNDCCTATTEYLRLTFKIDFVCQSCGCKCREQGLCDIPNPISYNVSYNIFIDVPLNHPILDFLDDYEEGEYIPLPESGQYCYSFDPNDDCNYPVYEKANNGNNLIDKKCLQGEPVNITTGNVYASAKDLHIPGRGFDLIFERSYNSQDPNEGPLGYGWTHNYNIFGYPISDTQSILMDGTGTGLHFIKIPNGNFVPIRDDGSLVTVNDGTSTYIKKNGTRYLFDSTAKLISISDKNSNTITLEYDDTNQNLISVSDGKGRQIRLEYNGNNKISELYGPTTSINPTGIVASYNYDSIGNLVKVSYSDGSEINYNYDDPLDSHNLTSITNGAGYNILAEYEYDDEDRAITTFSEGDLWKLSISYDSNTQTTVTDALENSQVYTYRTIRGINVIDPNPPSNLECSAFL